MKRFLASLFILLSCILCISVAACRGNGGSSNPKISFETNGGKAIEAVEVEKGTEYTLPVPEYDGYEFEGWYLNGELTGSSVEKVTVENSMTVYAKWAKLYTVTLDADGGTLSGGSFKLKEGGNLYDAVNKYVPTKTDYLFDSWLNLSTNSKVVYYSKMPSSDVTLKAVYKIKYTVEIYKEKFEGNGYDHDVTEDVTGYGEVGKTIDNILNYLPRDVMKGFTAASTSDTSIKITDTPANNVCRVYLDRDEYTVTFYANYPGGGNTVIKRETVRYGTQVVLPNDIAFAGYCLTGWALTQSGAAAYKVDSVTGKIYNPPAGADTQAKETKFTPEGNIGLYAVWTAGYVDMFGGSDVVFVFNAGGNEAYLYRNGIYFVGSYSAADRKVTFAVNGNDFSLECLLLENGDFVYYDAARDASYNVYSYRLTDDGRVQGFMDSMSEISSDGFNGITYTTTDSNGVKSSSSGTFVVDEYGYYVSTFTSGALAGQTLTVMLTDVQLSDGTLKTAARIRNEEEYELGVIYCSALFEGELTYYYSSSSYSLYSLMLSGFNFALYIGESSFAEYLYLIEDGIITLVSTATNQVLFTAKLIEIDDVTCYSVYTGEHDLTATSGSDRLVLDGYGNAKYTAAGATTSGYYVVSETGFGDYLVTMYASGEEYKNFIVTDSSAGNGSGATRSYTYTVKPVGYAEFVYTNESRIYTETYLVLNDESAGKAAIYSSGHKISTGRYEPMNTGLFIYTKETWEVPSGVKLPFVSTKFTSFVFTLGSKMTSNYDTYYVNIWTEYEEEGSNKPLYTEYANGDDKLDLLNFGSIAIYKKAGAESYVLGSYMQSSVEGVIILAADRYYFFELNEDDKTFEMLSFEPYTIYALTTALEVNENVYLYFTGRMTFAEEYYCTYTEDGASYEGLLTIDGASGECVFVSDDDSKNITFKLLSNSVQSFMAIYNAKYEGVYLSSYGRLTLDGYGTVALYNGDSSMYLVTEDDMVVLVYADGYIYIDLDVENKSFTVRDSAYGSYLFSDNQYYNGYVFEFDGYGVLKVYSLEDVDEDGNITYICEDGTYELKNDTVTVHYNNGTIDIDREGVFGIYWDGINTYRTFCFTYAEIANTYVSTSDWSVITLDASGNAVKYDKYGNVGVGTYVIITDDLFYFATYDGTDAAIYRYDTVAALASPVKNEARGYYTQDMQSVLFSDYGFAVFNGEERYFYDVEENGVVIYRHIEEGETGANKYGFVKDTSLGKFSNELSYGGKTYYYNKGGYAITFKRVASDETKFPVKSEGGTSSYLQEIEFVPSGDNASYDAIGYAVLGGVKYVAIVSREVDDGGVTSYYVTVNGYRYKVALSYVGFTGNDESASTFTVTELAGLKTLYSDTYLTYYTSYAMIGMSLSNTWGIIELMTEYDDKGEKTGVCVNGVFGENSFAYDTEGNLIAFEKADYEYDEDSHTYTVTLGYKDENTYTIAFEVVKNSLTEEDAYKLRYVTREEVLTYGNYKVEVQILISSEFYQPDYFGSIFDATLYENGEEIENSVGLLAEDGIYYVSRTYDDDKITSTTYYKITLTPDGVWEEGSNIIPGYSKAEVTKIDTVTTYYADDGKSYVDVDTAGHEVLFVYIYDESAQAGEGYAVSSCKYSESDSSYKVTLASGDVYTVRITEGKAELIEG